MHIRGGRQYQNIVDFQISVKSDSIPFPDSCAKSAKCYTGFRSSVCNLIINVHCSGMSDSKIGDFINKVYFCPLTVMVGSPYGFPDAGCMVYNLSLFVLIVS